MICDFKTDRRRVFPAAVLALSQIKEEREESLLISQGEECFRVHGFIVMGDGKMHMAAQG